VQVIRITKEYNGEELVVTDAAYEARPRLPPPTSTFAASTRT
jgi:hypothetical protein